MTACPSCGAAVRVDAARCPLCGTDLAADRTAADDIETVLDPSTHSESAPPAVVAGAASRPEPTTCATCGQLNPAGARFCNACGAPLGAPSGAEVPGPVRASPPPVSTSETPAAGATPAAGRRALVLVGAGVAAVVVLYVATSRSGAPADPTPASPSAVAGAEGAPAAVPDGPAPPLPDSLQRAADALEAQGTASSWYEAGRYYLTAGFDAQQAGTGGDAGVLWIRRAMADFEKSLAVENNPDVRFALAEASQFDPSNPMRPVTELRTLLDETPDHLGGNFLLGERRLLIGRTDSARVSFERVAALAPPGDPLGERARLRLAELSQPATGPATGPATALTRGAPDAGAPAGGIGSAPAGTPGAP